MEQDKDEFVQSTTLNLPKVAGAHSLRIFHGRRNSIENANAIHDMRMSRLDRLALAITNKVGSMGFFFLILAWTVLWTGYNVVASEFPRLHWKAFDPYPAFVAYLLMSNAIQILLMPLIMVGQTVQSRHDQIRADQDHTLALQSEQNTEQIISLLTQIGAQVHELRQKP